MLNIYIRQMRYQEAELKLEAELHSAFLQGRTLVKIIHGKGEGKLQELVRVIVERSGFSKIQEPILTAESGYTIVELFPPDKSTLKQYSS